MTRTRLHTVAPDLDAALGSAAVERRRSVGWIVARWAIDRTELSDWAIDAALSGVGTPDVTALVAALVEDLDRQYFDLQDASETDPDIGPAALIAFSRARAASAVDFAARGNVVEAVYEAGQATGLGRDPNPCRIQPLIGSANVEHAGTVESGPTMSDFARAHPRAVRSSFRSFLVRSRPNRVCSNRRRFGVRKLAAASRGIAACLFVRLHHPTVAFY